ncbi:MAG: Qat anti-phage system ATPase QatA [Candidatus Binatia bacterium]
MGKEHKGPGGRALLSDQETKVDLLNNEAIAATIVDLLCEQPDRPITIGVHGDWGAGKSSILEMIEAGLEGEAHVLCLKFNGWRFQGFEDAKIALLEGIVSGLLEKRPALTKAAEAVKAVFRRIDWLKVAKRAGGLALTAYTGVPTPGQIQTVVSAVQGLFADPTKIVTKENAAAVIEETESLLKPEADSKNVPEEIGEFRKAFDELLGAAKIDRLVVLIDDLDRCLPDIAIETLEAMRLFVFTSRTAFVVAADEAMIEYAVRKHFPDLPDTTGPQTYARNYLEKLIQVPFRIPPLGETETRIYVTLLLIGAEIGENDEAFGRLIAAARERLKRPWASSALDAATVNTALGDKAAGAHSALTLSDQIGPILASGTKGNPRQIKRFLNTLVLRHRTAEARGFGDDVMVPILAKLMLAERFMPRLFDQIASAAAASPNGVCDDLAALESAAEAERPPSRVQSNEKRRGDGKETPKLEVLKPGDGGMVSEWLSSKPTRAWAAIQPSLKGIDLRPYLFVTKDRKDYFGAASVLGHLNSIVEQLLGPKLFVQALDAELKRLAHAEAGQVFEAVRGRIVGSASFETEPAGVAGLSVLVKAHPKLQPNLMDFLEALPRERLGPWVLGGWEGVIRDPEFIQRLDRFIQSLAKDATNDLLRAAASNALRTRQGPK